MSDSDGIQISDKPPWEHAGKEFFAARRWRKVAKNVPKIHSIRGVLTGHCRRSTACGRRAFLSIMGLCLSRTEDFSHDDAKDGSPLKSRIRDDELTLPLKISFPKIFRYCPFSGNKDLNDSFMDLVRMVADGR